MFSSSFAEQSRLSKAVYITVRTATKRASAGHGQNNNTAGRRLGMKCGDGEFVLPGQIIWRQRGTNWYPGDNTGIGRDHTIFANEPGYVRYYRDPFHAKRKFIGVALVQGERLPTPHMAPRRRRFGMVPIPDVEVAEEERMYLKKKEVEAQIVSEIKFEVRHENRLAREESYGAVITECCPELGEETSVDMLQVQTERYSRLLSFLQGGYSYSKALEIVNSNDAEDYAIALRSGQLTQEEYDLIMTEHTRVCTMVDEAVKFGPRFHLLPSASLSNIEEQKSKALAELDALTANVDSTAGTPKELKSKILDIINLPIFSFSELESLRKRYILKPLPVPIQAENRAELQKLAKNGKGKIMGIWDYSKRKAVQHYLPPNAEYRYC